MQRVRREFEELYGLAGEDLAMAVAREPAALLDPQVIILKETLHALGNVAQPNLQIIIAAQVRGFPFSKSHTIHSKHISAKLLLLYLKMLYFTST